MNTGMITGLRTGPTSGINPSGAVVVPAVYPESGTQMATWMGIATAPNLLARFDSATAPVTDLAGGDDDIDTVRSGVGVAEDERLGVCATLPQNESYWARYADTTKFNFGTGSFAVSWLGKITNTGLNYPIIGKYVSSGTAGWLIYVTSTYVTFSVGDGVSRVTAQCNLATTDQDYLMIHAGVNRTTGEMYLIVNNDIATNTAPTGSVDNAARFNFGPYDTRSPEMLLAQAAIWAGAGAEEVDRAAHNNLLAEMDLVETPTMVSVWLGQSNMDGRADVVDISAADSDYAVERYDLPWAYQSACGDDYPALCSTRNDWAPLGSLSTFGPWLSGTVDLAASQPTGSHRSIVSAMGGTDVVDDWDPTATSGAAMWPRSEAFIDEVLADIGDAQIQCMAWYQGERDAGLASTTYQADLQKLYDAITAKYGGDWPFVVVKLGSWQSSINTTNLNTIRAAQEAFVAANANAFIVDTDAYGSSPDALHADADTYIQIGKDIAAVVAAFYGWA